MRKPLDRTQASRAFGPPIAPVIVSRVPVFSPVGRRDRRRAATTWTWQTPWGEVQITGCLTQEHRQLLDAAVATAVAVENLPDDGSGLPGCRLVLDPHRLCRAMGTTTWDYRWVEDLCRDLHSAVIRIVEHGHAFPLLVTSVVTSYGRWRKLSLRPGRLTHKSLPGGEPDPGRETIFITLSGAWRALWGDHPTAHYATLLPRIAELRPVSQAIARLCLTQRDGWQIHLDHALQAVGAWDNGSGRSAQERRWEARKAVRDDADRLAELGITLDGNTLRYRRPADAYVSLPGEG